MLRVHNTRLRNAAMQHEQGSNRLTMFRQMGGRARRKPL